MSADKKIDRNKLPHPEKADSQNKSQEEFDDKRKQERERIKARKVDYVVKDLPIY